MTSEPSVQQLYRRWREQDPQAEDDLSRRFDLWFKALSLFYYGRNYEPQYNKTCTNFSAEFSSVAKSTDLIPFAYTKVQENIHPPKQPLHRSKVKYDIDDQIDFVPEDLYHITLIKKVFGDLESEDQEILRLIYQQDTNLEEAIEENTVLSEKVKSDFAHHGLLARQNLKSLLQQNPEITFYSSLTNRDHSPLPLYEGTKLNSPAEVERFERWLLTSTEICNDLILFVPFAHALRDFCNQPNLEQIPTPAMEEPIQEKEPTKELTVDMPKEGYDYGKILLTVFLITLIILALFILFTR